MILAPVLPKAAVLQNVDEFEVLLGLHPQTELSDPGEDDSGPPDQDGTSDTLVYHLLGGLQDPSLFAFGVHESLPGAGQPSRRPAS